MYIGSGETAFQQSVGVTRYHVLVPDNKYNMTFIYYLATAEYGALSDHFLFFAGPALFRWPFSPLHWPFYLLYFSIGPLFNLEFTYAAFLFCTGRYALFNGRIMFFHWPFFTAVFSRALVVFNRFI